MAVTVLVSVFLLGAVALFFVLDQGWAVQGAVRVRALLPRSEMGLRLCLQAVAFGVFVVALDLFGRYCLFLD